MQLQRQFIARIQGENERITLSHRELVRGYNLELQQNHGHCLSKHTLSFFSGDQYFNRS